MKQPKKGKREREKKTDLTKFMYPVGYRRPNPLVNRLSADSQ